ncbi:hypothetical protein P280DRAFT_247191 [Massarina eburnea CBS 473.64]|uniref:Uncharacterized protein n=1 Tax=Massarina eburnea CBS 473.64 TaxID=1395130 RepID=A0A6A6S7Q4_9PLEO|nr:hypothetical protein P280DRAFT_247191 [Massarina eburnea CBS 473.64]
MLGMAATNWRAEPLSNHGPRPAAALPLPCKSRTFHRASHPISALLPFCPSALHCAHLPLLIIQFFVGFAPASRFFFSIGAQVQTSISGRHVASLCFRSIPAMLRPGGQALAGSLPDVPRSILQPCQSSPFCFRHRGSRSPGLDRKRNRSFLR